jgi:CBS domain-containing protein
MSTALITVTPGQTVELADLEMKLAGIHHILVVDERNHLVGIVSDRDLLRAFGLTDQKQITMRDVMTTDVRTVDQDASAKIAVQLMLDNDIGCLPVTGDEGQLAGLVTATDFLQVAARALSDESLGR